MAVYAVVLMACAALCWSAPMKVGDSSWEALVSVHSEFVVLFYAEWW